MKSTLQNIANSHNGHFNEREFRWWNGHGFMDGSEYKVSLQINKSRIQLNYERLNSEFEKNGVLGGTHSSRNKCSIILTSKNKIPDFEIRKLPLRKRLFGDHELNFEVKSKDPQLKNVLNNSNEVRAIYEEVFQLPEFEPEIIAKYDEGTFRLRITYQTQINRPEIIKIMMRFITLVSTL